MALPTTITDVMKGFPLGHAPLDLAEIGKQGWNLLAGDLPFPSCILKESAVANNAAWFRRFTELAGVSLAPHGKTTMSPQLFRRQLDGGAWGMTLATGQQLRVGRAAGVERIILANQLVDPVAIRYVLDELERDSGFDFFCLVDSVAGVERLAAAVVERGGRRPLQVLIEAGIAGGRAGCRTLGEVRQVADAIREAGGGLSLRGVEGFEGVFMPGGPEERMAVIENFLALMVSAVKAGVEEDWFAPGEIILSAGGSAHYDVVARDLTASGYGDRIRVVLRSGCYFSHDSGSYDDHHKDIQARSALAREAGAGLRPALEVWGLVQSMPEPGLALLTFGKRDISFDARMPVPERWAPSDGSSPVAIMPEGHEIHQLNDQHAFMRVPADTPLRIGDRVGCGISHPCTTFDRWQLIYVVDDDYNVIDAVRTFF